jgi:serine/threonine-protein kinase SRPK3
LKILTNDVTALQGSEAFELECLKSIASAQSGGGQKRLIHLEDHFTIRGEHGDHLCLVTSPLGPSLLEVMEVLDGMSQSGSQRLPLPMVKRVTRHLLEALRILHEQCEIIHTGKLGFGANRLSSLSESDSFAPNRYQS